MRSLGLLVVGHEVPHNVRPQLCPTRAPDQRRLSGYRLNGCVLAERVQEGFFPLVLVARAAELVVEDPAGPIGDVAANVVTEQEVGEQQVSPVGQDRVRVGQRGRVVAADRVTADPPATSAFRVQRTSAGGPDVIPARPTDCPS